MAKKSTRGTGARKTPSTRRAGSGARAMAATKGGRRKTAGAKTPKGKARRTSSSNAPRPGKRKGGPAAPGAARAGAKAGAARKTARKKTATAKTGTGGNRSARTAKSTARAGGGGRRQGGSGREKTLAQTPETGRTTRGPTNPMKTKRSTGTGAGAGSSRSPRLERDRKLLREIEEQTDANIPSSLDLDRSASAVRTGRQRLQDAREEHHETGPALTGGDVDADWEDAYAVGDEAPGGDNPTPDQDRVDDIGKALGVEYQDNEELKASDKISERDKHRWELDPASSEDYRDRE